MPRLLCAGQAVLDFIFHVEKMPDRAEKYRAADAAISGGGCAANAAVMAARLGADVTLAAPLGDDDVAAMIIRDLEREGVNCSHVHRHAGMRSSCSSVLVDAGGERQIVNFRDPALYARAGELDGVALSDFDAALADTRWPAGAALAMAAARQLGIPGVMDGEAPLSVAREALHAASHIGFSVQGLRDFGDHDDIEAGLRHAAEETGAWVCVTRGAEGVTWLDGGTLRHMAGFAVDAKETLGAGDCWHGAFALALAEGRGEEEAIRFASAAAALKCIKSGGRASYPHRDAVDRFIKERQAA